jgi:histidinol-phosphatase (PHP family)
MRSKAHGWFDYDAILGQVQRARLAYPALKVWMSVEVGWDPRYEAEIRGFLAAHRFDFVLGALHAVEGRDVGPELFSGISLEEAGRRYLAAATRAVKTGLFDVLAHADLPKRYGIAHYGKAWDAEACEREGEALAQALVESGTMLELNTSGLRQAPKECLPGPFLLGLYRRAGGRRVTLASDAHSLGHVGHGFVEAAAGAQRLGLAVLSDSAAWLSSPGRASKRRKP